MSPQHPVRPVVQTFLVKKCGSARSVTAHEQQHQDQNPLLGSPALLHVQRLGSSHPLSSSLDPHLALVSAGRQGLA
jgi:hypothetical protein